MRKCRRGKGQGTLSVFFSRRITALEVAFINKSVNILEPFKDRTMLLTQH